MSAAAAVFDERHPMFVAPLPFLESLAKRYPDLARFHIGNQPCFLALHPDLVHEVLVKQADIIQRYAPMPGTLVRSGATAVLDGELHRRLRPDVVGALRGEILERALSLTREEVVRARESWERKTPFDMSELMGMVIMRILIRLLFGESSAECVEIVERIVEARCLELSANPNKEPILNRLCLQLDSLLGDLIARTKRSGAKASILRGFVSSKLDDTQIRNELIFSVIATSESVVPTLAWAWYQLSRSDSVALALKEDQEGRYARWVFQEALRLYPSAWLLARVAHAETRLGEHRVPANALVYICPYLTQRDERFFPSAHAFEPGRWDPRSRFHSNAHAYFPFGAGVHRCVGEGLSLVLGAETIRCFSQYRKVRQLEDRPIEILALPDSPLRLKQRLWMVPDTIS